MHHRSLMLAASLALGACATAPPPRVTAPAAQDPPATRQERTRAFEALAVERQWLDSWFQGTPVSIVQGNDGSITVAVPRAHSFDSGRSRIKSALGAVLDKVAESLRRRPDARVVQLLAPDDGAPQPALAVERAAQVRRHLQERGVSVQRMAEPAGVGVGVAAVQLRIAL